MTETAAQRELARQVARLQREAQTPPTDAHSVHCAMHGPQYACSAARPVKHTSLRFHEVPNEVVVWRIRCGHIACKAIVNGRCPECPGEES